MGRRSRPGLGFRDGRDDLVLGPSFLHHPLDERAKVVRVRGCRQGSHRDPFASFARAAATPVSGHQSPDPEAGTMPDRVASTAGLTTF